MTEPTSTEQLLLKQLTRQLKLLNIWITIFGTIILIALIALAILVYQAISFTRSVSEKVDTTQQSIRDNLNVRDRVCSGQADDSLLNRYSNICE